MHSKISFVFKFLIFFLPCLAASATNFPASLFPLEHYDQNITTWISPQSPDYKKPILSLEYQQQRLKEFRSHLFSTEPNAPSPWSEEFVSKILNADSWVLSHVNEALLSVNNQGKTGKDLSYGENYRPHPDEWVKSIENNIDLKPLTLPIQYKPANRAIVIRNTFVRMLPTDEPSFYSLEIAGQGYPFDNLQASALWVGTPVYMIAQTRDAAWSLILTPSFIGWVKTNTFANTNSAFIHTWETATQKQLVAIIHTQTPLIDYRNKKFLATTYIGSVFPLLGETPTSFKIGFPMKSLDGNVHVRTALVEKQYAAKMPLPAIPGNFAFILNNLKNRPYGWGGSYFYNDCSAELESLFTPFGIWLPRNSSKQSMAGKVMNLDTEPAEKRLDDLIKNGHPLMTLVFIGGHVFMYVGNYPNSNTAGHESMAMSYQNIWGLSPKDGSKRAIIGQSAFLPLLMSYPEDTTLSPLVDKKHFQIIYLDQWPDEKPDWNHLFFTQNNLKLNQR